MQPEWLYHGIKGGSNLAVVLAVIGAQRAVLPAAWPLSLLFASMLVGANTVTREFGATATILAIGVLPVIGASVFFLARAAWRTRVGRVRECGWLCAGWAAFVLAGLAWAARAGFSPWFDHTDVAHLFMMAALFLILRSGMAREAWT